MHGGNEAGDDHRPLEHGAARQVGTGHAGGGFVTTAHSGSPVAKLAILGPVTSRFAGRICPKGSRGAIGFPMSERVKGSVPNTVCYIADATAGMDKPAPP